MKYKKETKPYVKIGIIGHVDCGKVKLIKAIEKTLKEKNDKKLKNERIKEKVESISKEKVFMDVSDIDLDT